MMTEDKVGFNKLNIKGSRAEKIWEVKLKASEKESLLHHTDRWPPGLYLPWSFSSVAAY